MIPGVGGGSNSSAARCRDTRDRMWPLENGLTSNPADRLRALMDIVILLPVVLTTRLRCS